MEFFNTPEIFSELKARGHRDFSLVTHGDDALSFWTSPPTWIADSNGKMICFFSQKVDGLGQVILHIDKDNGYNHWHFNSYPTTNTTKTRTFALCISGELTEYGGMLPIVSGPTAN
ncbi:hypothetical protein ACJ8PG_23560 [Serratia sp. CY68758]|uniref:hypothetical protein n=1 Tax=Serratia TaxID=613 RepID=UPI003EDEF5A8